MLLRLKLSDTLNDGEYLVKVYAKLVNCNFDGVSVMSESDSGIKTRMKERQNGLIYMHCATHQLELVVRDSVKSDNYFDRLDEIINNINYSLPLHREELTNLPLLFNEIFKGCGCYIFASLFFKSKREHLSN